MYVNTSLLIFIYFRYWEIKRISEHTVLMTYIVSKYY